MFTSKLLWIAIFIFGVVPPVIILVLYDYSVSGEYFSLLSKGINISLSKKSGDWSNFGSLLSGVFTLLSAIASLATLIFLLQQQKKNDQERSEQLRIQKEIQDKNNLHLEAKKELMKFEMYKTHKEMFDDVLNKIEIASSGFKFKDRNSLYNKIFTNNSFFNIEIKVEIQSNLFLDVIKKRYLCLLENVKNHWGIDNNDSKIFSYIYEFKLINDELGLESVEEPKSWDFLYAGRPIGLNALTPWVSFLTYHNMISDILSFTGNGRLQDKIISDWGEIIFESISKITLPFDSNDVITYKNFGLLCPYNELGSLTNLIELYEICKKNRRVDPTRLQCTYTHIISSYSPSIIYERFPRNINDVYRKALDIYNRELAKI
ncbi:hypothetical protein GJ675_17095 [Hafnia alvei]|uniref:Phage abortive infection protein n=1 Tax=Hafnia alvei TaxID=569 RepID=A0A1C6YV01_HAFAL|nr:hypothetical protein [Hafnia alvei]SCM50692.1 hypothetical protein BN1044_00140 [Hafnia alvei]